MPTGSPPVVTREGTCIRLHGDVLRFEEPPLTVPKTFAAQSVVLLRGSSAANRLDNAAAT
jgi:hypothetical protein